MGSVPLTIPSANNWVPLQCPNRVSPYSPNTRVSLAILSANNSSVPLTIPSANNWVPLQCPNRVSPYSPNTRVSLAIPNANNSVPLAIPSGNNRVPAPPKQNHGFRISTLEAQPQQPEPRNHNFFPICRTPMLTEWHKN